MPVRGPRLKIIRRLGVQLPGLTRKDGERRPTPPGQHGATTMRRRKTSLFRKRLEEKQKVRFNYGVTERQMVRYMERATSMGGVTAHNLLALLESRLDNVVFRLGFAPTIPAARQLVSHGHVHVNGRRVDRASYQLSSGDTVAVAPGSREVAAILAAVERGPQLRLPSYLAMDPADKLTGRLIGTPMRQDVPFPVDDAAIVEHYAR